MNRFDVEYANKCAELFIGTHDFSSFRDSDCQAKSPIKTINSFEFCEEGGFIVAKICAKSFLHHQIRIMIGTIFQLYVKNKEPCEILKMISKKSRIYAGMTAPAKGLFLYKIEYKNKV